MTTTIINDVVYFNPEWNCSHLKNPQEIPYYTLENKRIYSSANISYMGPNKFAVKFDATPFLISVLDSPIKTARCYECIKQAGDLDKIVTSYMQNRQRPSFAVVQETEKKSVTEKKA
ncbi:MAG: hypothetical protein V4487_01130 [Chlamydiota bacterium]